MKEGLIERIKSRGYWRINFQPMVAKTKLATMQDCSQVVERNSVKLRGWDFPVFPRGVSPERGGLQACGEYFEGWVDWEYFLEFWRMYRSGQLLSYLGNRLDWMEDADRRARGVSQVKPGAHLAVEDTIYLLTEVYEFLARLTRAGLYDEGVRVSVSCHNLASRSLFIEDPARMPFSIERRTGAPDFTRVEELTKSAILERPQDLALKTILALFDVFEWNPSPEQIAKDQEKLLTRRL